MPRIIMNRAFIARWTRMPHSIGRLSASASLHRSLSLAAFITNTAESDFRHAHHLGRRLDGLPYAAAIGHDPGTRGARAVRAQTLPACHAAQARPRAGRRVTESWSSAALCLPGLSDAP